MYIVVSKQASGFPKGFTERGNSLSICHNRCAGGLNVGQHRKTLRTGNIVRTTAHSQRGAKDKWKNHRKEIKPLYGKYQ